MKVAIAHDYLTQRGGAERVVLSLHRLFPEAPIYTSLYDPDTTFPAFRNADVRASFLQHVPHTGDRFRALLPLYPLAFRRPLRGYELVITSSSGWAHSTRVFGGFHLCYCYTPARWLYQTGSYVSEGGPIPRRLWSATAPLLAGLRRWDQTAARRPDAYVAISKTVAERIATTYGREARVLAPPVDVARLVDAAPRSATPGDYYLVVARLLPYKRVDHVIDACHRRSARLVIVGDGPAGPALRRQHRGSGANVEFLGQVSETDLIELLHGCRALIQAGEEDFGLGPLEANACGRPTVAFGRGGALDTVVDGVTGILFPEPRVEALVDALGRVESITWAPDVLRAHASGFAEDHFHAGLAALLAELAGVSVQVGAQAA